MRPHLPPPVLRGDQARDRAIPLRGEGGQGAAALGVVGIAQEKVEGARLGGAPEHEIPHGLGLPRPLPRRFRIGLVASAPALEMKREKRHALRPQGEGRLEHAPPDESLVVATWIRHGIVGRPGKRRPPREHREMPVGVLAGGPEQMRVPAALPGQVPLQLPQMGLIAHFLHHEHIGIEPDNDGAQARLGLLRLRKALLIADGGHPPGLIVVLDIVRGHDEVRPRKCAEPDPQQQPHRPLRPAHGVVLLLGRP